MSIDKCDKIFLVFLGRMTKIQENVQDSVNDVQESDNARREAVCGVAAPATVGRGLAPAAWWTAEDVGPYGGMAAPPVIILSSCLLYLLF